MKISISNVIALLEKKAPFHSAHEGDNSGLLIGDPHTPVTGILVAIDLTEQAIQWAIKKHCNLIITHHPCLFPKNPLLQLSSKTPLYQAIQSGLSVIACHSNFDAQPLSSELIQGLGCTPKTRFFTNSPSAYELIFYAPLSHAEKIFRGLCQAGAGNIGPYQQCGFFTKGKGHFIPLSDAKPFSTPSSDHNTVSEIRIEVMVPASKKKDVLKALHQLHPYEQIAYQWMAIETDQKALPDTGCGLIGIYPKPLSFKQLSKKIKKTFSIQHFRLTGSEKGTTHTLGFIPGSGKSFLKEALQQGCNTFITGEIDYHLALFACINGCRVIELGHTQSEVFFYKVIPQWLHPLKLPLISSHHLLQKLL